MFNKAEVYSGSAPVSPGWPVFVFPQNCTLLPVFRLQKQSPTDPKIRTKVVLQPQNVTTEEKKSKSSI